MTSNEVHDLQQSGASAFISLAVSPLNTHQACTFITIHFFVPQKSLLRKDWAICVLCSDWGPDGGHCSSTPPGSFLKIKIKIRMWWFVHLVHDQWKSIVFNRISIFNFHCGFIQCRKQRWDHAATLRLRCCGWMHQYFWHGMASTNFYTNMTRGWRIQNLNALKRWAGGEGVILYFIFLDRGHVSDWTETHQHDCLPWNDVTV